MLPILVKTTVHSLFNATPLIATSYSVNILQFFVNEVSHKAKLKINCEKELLRELCLSEVFIRKALFRVI